MRVYLTILLLIPAFGCAVFSGGDTTFPLAGGYELTRIADGFHLTEGPLWVPGENALLFSDLELALPCWRSLKPCGVIYRLDPTGRLEVARKPSFNSTGLALDPSGTLLAAEGTTHRIARLSADGSVGVVAERFGGRPFNAPNDLVVARDGAVYFTDPDLATWVGRRRLGFNGVYRIAPRSREIRLVSDALREPNGVALSRDETILYVSDEMKGNVVAFHLDANGQARDRRKFAGHLPGADGMTVDAYDNLYVATKRGIVVLTPSGRRIASLTIEDPETREPVRPSNCTFGGPDGNTLFVTAEHAVYRLEPRSGAPANSSRTAP